MPQQQSTSFYIPITFQVIPGYLNIDIIALLPASLYVPRYIKQIDMPGKVNLIEDDFEKDFKWSFNYDYNKYITDIGLTFKTAEILKRRLVVNFNYARSAYTNDIPINFVVERLFDKDQTISFEYKTTEYNKDQKVELKYEEQKIYKDIEINCSTLELFKYDIDGSFEYTASRTVYDISIDFIVENLFDQDQLISFDYQSVKYEDNTKSIIKSKLEYVAEDYISEPTNINFEYISQNHSSQLLSGNFEYTEENFVSPTQSIIGNLQYIEDTFNKKILKGSLDYEESKYVPTDKENNIDGNLLYTENTFKYDIIPNGKLKYETSYFTEQILSGLVELTSREYEPNDKENEILGSFSFVEDTNFKYVIPGKVFIANRTQYQKDILTQFNYIGNVPLEPDENTDIHGTFEFVEESNFQYDYKGVFHYSARSADLYLNCQFELLEGNNSDIDNPERLSISGNFNYESGIYSTYEIFNIMVDDYEPIHYDQECIFNYEEQHSLTDLPGQLTLFKGYYAVDLPLSFKVKRNFFKHSIFISFTVPHRYCAEMPIKFDINPNKPIYEDIEFNFEVDDSNVIRKNINGFMELEYSNLHDWIMSDDPLIHDGTNRDKLAYWYAIAGHYLDIPFPPHELQGEFIYEEPYIIADIIGQVEVEQTYTRKEIDITFTIEYGLEYDIPIEFFCIPPERPRHYHRHISYNDIINADIPFTFHVDSKYKRYHIHHYDYQFDADHIYVKDININFEVNSKYKENNIIVSKHKIESIPNPKGRIIILVSSMWHFDPFTFKGSLITFLERHYQKYDFELYYGGNPRSDWDITNLALNYRIDIRKLHRIPICFDFKNPQMNKICLDNFIAQAFGNIDQYKISRIFVFMNQPLQYVNDPVGKVVLLARKLDLSCVCISSSGEYFEINKLDKINDALSNNLEWNRQHHRMNKGQYEVLQLIKDPEYITY